MKTLLFILISFCSIVIGQEKNKSIIITSPANNSKVYERVITIEGKSSGYDKNTKIGIFVKTNDEYKQGETIIKPDGTWIFSQVYLGTETSRNLAADVYIKIDKKIVSNIISIVRVR